MSAKQEATFHGSPVEARLRLYANHASDWEIMFEAADTISSLRAQLQDARVALSVQPKVVEVHHHDIEKHAESFNEGYETAVAHALMTDSELENQFASDWLSAHEVQAKRLAWDEGHHAGVWNATDDTGAPFKDNPYGPANV